MQSIRELYRIGHGPSSSHTMAPRRAAEQFRARYPSAEGYRVTLYGSLAATGRGHMTDRAIESALAPVPADITWEPDIELPFHPNGMSFQAILPDGSATDPWVIYSVGGGALAQPDDTPPPGIYDLHSMAEILERCEETGQSLWEYVEEREGEGIWAYLAQIADAMGAAIERGLVKEGVLPGGLGLTRRAWVIHRKMTIAGSAPNRFELLYAYALAVSEENASGGVVVTAPTCGSSGVVPAVLRYVQEITGCADEALLHALATAGLVGNLVKHNASISGAEVGCQGEVGVACAMAAAAAAQLFGGTVRQIEYAAEMGLEHNLGLTCDPVAGMVQIPCIERNAFAASKAFNCADYALLSDGSHRVPFDDVVAVLWETGNNLPSLYRETSTGGLAEAYRLRQRAGKPVAGPLADR
jgi:L-serine dehydratase